MDINYELGIKFKNELKHQNGLCHFNAYDLLERQLIDALVLGYIVLENNGHKTAFRHSWGIKSDKIVDSSVAPKKEENFKYIECYRVLSDQKDEVFSKYPSHLIGYREYDETNLVKKLESENILVIGTCSIKTRRIIRKLAKKKIRAEKMLN